MSRSLSRVKSLSLRSRFLPATSRNPLTNCEVNSSLYAGGDMSDVTLPENADDHDDHYDPFAVFQAMAAGPSSQELYGKFADLRAEAPVHLEPPPDGEGRDGKVRGNSEVHVTRQPPWGPEPRFTTVSFEAANGVLGDPDMSSGGYYERVSVVF